MICLMKNTATCTDDVKLAVAKNDTEKWMDIQSMCPMVKITHDMCTPLEKKPRRCAVGMASTCLYQLYQPGTDKCK